MALAGGGALVLWNDIGDEAKADFHTWHAEEHIPGRLRVPGIHRVSRYAAVQAQPEYFTLFETDRPDVFHSAAYRSQSGRPPSELETRLDSHFRPGPRLVCSVVSSEGRGRSGLIATLLYSVADTQPNKHAQTMIEHVLPSWAACSEISGVHLLRAEPASSAAIEHTEVSRWVLLCEGWGDLDAFQREAARLRSKHTEPNVAELQWGIYRLQYTTQIERAAEPQTNVGAAA